MLPRQIVGFKIVSIRVHKSKQREKDRENLDLKIKRLKGIALVLFLFANSCSIEGSTHSNVCGRDRSDGPVFYDAAKSICCDGKVHPLLTNGSEHGCCTRKGISGNETQEIYDKGVKLCCGPQLVPLYNGWYERKCCKGDDEDQFPGEVQEEGFQCCNGRTYKLAENEDCCGTMKYDYNKYTCCNVSLQAYVNFASPACCGEQPYDENTHWCDDSVWPHVVTDLHFPKCAGERYDTANYVCCDDEKGPLLKKPVTKPWYSQLQYIEYICCNDALYDRTEAVCCPAIPEKNIVEHPIEIEYSCCGNGSVKKNNPLEQCCNGVANRIKDYVPGDPWVPHLCCGTKYVKDGRCCNGKEMEPEYACCGGTVEYSRNSALDCCGTDVYDRNHQVCCKKSSANQFTKDKDRGDDTDCCMPAEVPYNRHTHNCTQAGVLEKPETRVATIRPCPYCRRKTQPSSYCRARNVYEVTIKRVRFTDKGSVLSARMNKEKINIRIPYRCPACIRQNTEYLIFTNRRVKEGKLKLKSKSTFFRKGDFPLQQVGTVCNVKQKIRRTVRRLTKEAVKKTIG